jgi:hypothetical protein
MEAEAGGSQGTGKFSGENLTMRKNLLIVVIVQCLLVLRGQAVTLPFEKDAEPFYSSTFQVVWAATNSLPITVRIFKVVPASYSAAAISNLTAMGGSVNSEQGWLGYDQPSSMDSPLENVPDKVRAYELGTNLLAKLGIPTDDLLSEDGKPMAGFSPDWRTHRDKITRKLISEPSLMGVEFRRTVDGLVCFDQQFRFQFASQGKLTQISARWLGLQPLKSCPTATPDQIVAWIKEGRARAQSIETTGQRWINVADIRKVTIRNLEVCYNASPDWDSEMPPADLYPYAMLSAEIEFSKDDHEMLGLYCPATTEAVCRVVSESSEFNILPRTFFEKQVQKGTGE